MEWFISILNWYLYLAVLGLLFWPLSKRLFGTFIDKGYAFSKTISIIILSYAIFLLGILHILPFSKESLIILLIISGFMIFRYFKKEIIEIKKLDPKTWLLIGGIEIMFFIGLVALSFVRGQEPSIHGLEKFMDFGFMQSINRSEYFPPKDMWLSADPTHPDGYPINYYYFGHLTGSFLIKLTGINPFVGYNLTLATIFAQGITLAFTLTASIVQRLQVLLNKGKGLSRIPSVITGLLGSFMVNLGGNLHTIYTLTKGYPNDKPIPFWEIFQSPKDISTTMSTGKGLFESIVQNSSYWYPNATRFIPFTIHEFPSYSYVVADLHGHVFDIPLVLVTIAIIWRFFEFWHSTDKKKPEFFKGFNIFNLFKKKTSFSNIKEKVHSLKIQKTEAIFSVLIGFMIGINYMTNAFDGPIYLLIAFVMFFYLYRTTLKFIALSVITIASFVVTTLPFSWFFEPFASSIGVNCSPDFLVKLEKLGPFLFEQGNCQVSPIYMLFVLWGFFWISAILLLVFLWKNGHFNKSPIIWIDSFVLMLFAYGTFLILVPEFFYIKDIYPGHFRANTMFKMGYQAFMMMSISSAYVFYRIGMWKSKLRFVLRGIFAFFFIFVFIYPFLAFPSYYPGLYDIETYRKSPNLDGSSWMASMYPQDKEIIDYINDNIAGQPVILEAQGDSYTDYDRVSAYTGVPTVAGWWVHQWLWRGSPGIVGDRIPDIEALYQSEDIQQTKHLINKYDIEYVVISNIEREKYPNINEEKFGQIGIKVFQSDNGFGALYKVY
ncbi:hypothetical protein IPM65_00965 [Candidatus Roizmanbacteria bacterium]|nr:MAG: hypothetical protein IPM65_00965 [Candidatus Roizmanbacteria bacterium]